MGDDSNSIFFVSRSSEFIFIFLPIVFFGYYTLIGISGIPDRGSFHFTADWNDEEDWGRWAKSEEAEIIFCPDPGYTFTGIYINARYFDGSQETSVYINDQLVGKQDFSINHLLEFGKPLKEWMGDSTLVRLRFESYGLTSPLEVNGEQDFRLLKFGIHSL